MKATPATAEFPMIAEFEADERAIQAKADRIRHVAAHRQSIAVCWPEWKIEVGGRCEVGQCNVWSLKHNESRYHYMAPCEILEISADGETFIVEIDYPEGTIGHCYAMNGERLRLDILDLWAPVRQLHTARYADQKNSPERKPEPESENEDHTCATDSATS